MKNTKFSIGKIKDIPNDPKLGYTKGAFYEKIGKLDKAIEAYKEASEEGHVKSQYTLGYVI